MDPSSNTGEQYSSERLMSGEKMLLKLMASVVPCDTLQIFARGRASKDSRGQGNTKDVS